MPPGGKARQVPLAPVGANIVAGGADLPLEAWRCGAVERKHVVRVADGQVGDFHPAAQARSQAKRTASMSGTCISKCAVRLTGGMPAPSAIE